MKGITYLTSSSKDEERVSRGRSKDKKVRKSRRGQSQESQMKSTLENKFNVSEVEKEPPKVMD